MFAGKSVPQVAELPGRELIRTLNKKPVVVGHSSAGFLTQIVAGRGLAAASVAIDPAPFPAAFFPLPVSALRSASPVLL